MDHDHSHYRVVDALAARFFDLPREEVAECLRAARWVGQVQAALVLTDEGR
jgi:hypothetical protein